MTSDSNKGEKYDRRRSNRRPLHRLSWALGPDAEADLIKGTDFIVTEDGRLKSVTGFLDKVPAGAGEGG
jgi:hypothetical protein